MELIIIKVKQKLVIKIAKILRIDLENITKLEVGMLRVKLFKSLKI